MVLDDEHGELDELAAADLLSFHPAEDDHEDEWENLPTSLRP